MAELQVDGRFVAHPYADLEWSTTWLHGSDSASWRMNPDLQPPNIRMGAPVRIYGAGVCVWQGYVSEPGTEGAYHATGLYSRAGDVIATDYSGNPWAVPNDVIGAAIGFGKLPWVMPPGVSLAASGDYPGDGTVQGVLDAWSASTGIRWQVGPDGLVSTVPPPSAPSWLVAYGRPSDGALTPAEDDFATHAVGRYLYATGDVRHVTAGDGWLGAKYGIREHAVSFEDQGIISTATAQALVDAEWAARGPRLSRTEAIHATTETLWSLGGGTVSSLDRVAAGQAVRIMGVMDNSGTALSGHLDVTIGRVTHHPDGTATLEPADLAARTFVSALAAALP